MIGLLLSILGSASGVQHGPFKTVPTGVILSGVGDNGSITPMLRAAEKIKSLHHFEQFDDELLVSKEGDLSFNFVKKSYPMYTRLRVRRHVMNLLKKIGPGTPFEYQDLATIEFEPYIRSMWRSQPQIVPGPKTKISFVILLQSSTTVGGRALEFSFSPSVSLSSQARQALSNSPASSLADKNEIADRAKNLYMTERISQYRVLIPMTANQELGLTRAALESFRIYLDRETTSIDSTIDGILVDPIWSNMKLRRKTKDMRDLKLRVPGDFNTIVSLHKEFSENAGYVPNDEEMAALQEAPLNNQYMLNISVMVDGRRIDLPLPI